MRKLIELLIAQHKFRKAMNILARQTWSTDYLIYLLKKSQVQGLTIRIKEPDGRVLELTMDAPTRADYAEREASMTQAEWDTLLGLKEDVRL